MPQGYYEDTRLVATTDWTTVQMGHQWNRAEGVKVLRSLRAFPLQNVLLETAAPMGDTQMDCVGFFWAQMEDQVVFPLTEPELFGDYEPLCWDGYLPMNGIEDIYFSYCGPTVAGPYRFWGAFE